MSEPKASPTAAPKRRRATSEVDSRLEQRRVPFQERSRETVRTVLRAAADVIDRDGLDHLTTRRIAQAAQISVGALYEYFPNKQAIVYALVVDWMERVFQVLDALHPRCGGAQDVLGYLGSQIDRMARLYADQPGLGALITMVTSVPELRDAVRLHDERCVASVVSALGHFAPAAGEDELRSTARTIAIIAHEILCEAIGRRADDAPRLVGNLKVCVFALGTRLLLPR